MHVRFVVAAVLLLSASASPKSKPQDKTKPSPLQETVTVLGAAEPVREGESSRSVQIIDMDEPQLYPETTSALRSDSSVDVQQRGAMGIQSDISIRGGTFAQTLVLLNGFRINDAETAHFNFDLPVPSNAIVGLDVLHGSGSTLYGTDALGGVVDVRLQRPTASELRLRTGVGSYGINQQAITASYLKGRWNGLLAGSRDFSTGFIPNRDYRSENLLHQSHLSTGLGETEVLLAGSDRAFGADQFYGAYPSWERTKAWFAALNQELGKQTRLQLAYRRHSDIFVLLRNNPAYYKNQHIDESWQAALRSSYSLKRSLTLAYGAEENTDQINSNSLGRHGRNRTAVYLNVELRKGAGTLSAGLREEVLSGGRVVSAPGVSGSYWLAKERLKIRGALGYGFRIPTYTDLYYKDPTTIPNPNIQPERAWNYEAGADWYVAERISVGITGFTSQQHQAIDYVRANASLPYQAQNLRDFRFTGLEAFSEFHFASSQEVRLSWTRLFGAASALNGLQSVYFFNYAPNNASASWIANLHQVSLRSRLGITERYLRTPYPTLDVTATRNAGNWRPYLQITNLSNTGYAEISGIRNQGRAFVGGIEVVLSKSH